MWFVVALVIGFALAALIFFLRSKNFKMAWYEWLIGAIGFLLVLFALQNYMTVSAEPNTKAANMFLLVVGLPGLILMAIAWQLSARRQKVT
jgi:uncharacterized membrane protein